MPYFTTKQAALFYCYAIGAEQAAKIDKYLSVLEQSGVAEIIRDMVTEKALGRSGLNPYAMFATILYGFAFGSPTLRELESSCRYDIRFMYLMNQYCPDYTTFSKYINLVIRPHAEEIFSCVVKSILKTCEICIDDCHIDGTKFQAKPNKYKVVWKPTKFHSRLSDKIRALLLDLGISCGIPKEGFVSSKMLAEKLSEASQIPEPLDPDQKKILKSKIKSLQDYLTKSIEYEEKEQICGPDRKSYFKTDHDATAMCLKEDYYSGLGSNMHPAYQMQVIVCKGFVVSYYVSQDRTDMHAFIKTLERFYKMYGHYPKSITADAGYGCYDNYQFCQANGIEAFVKYLSWDGECSGRRPALYELNPDDSIKCLGGITGYPEKNITGRHAKIKNAIFYRIQCPTSCLFMPYCRRTMASLVGEERIFELNINYQRMKQEARDRLLSVRGIEMRVNRSCQVEGVYGITKYDMSYNRIRRTGMQRVSVEYMLTVLGLNIRKLFRYFDGKTNLTYWKAPEGMQPEKFKKPSAKRLTNQVLHKPKKSVNEIARTAGRVKRKYL